MTTDAAGPPLWFLDVDGVLNPFTAEPDHRVWPDWRTGAAAVAGSAWPIRFSPGLTAHIARLHQSGLAEVCWLSTWGHAANDDLRLLLGLPELPVAGALDDDLSGRPATGPAEASQDGSWWKLDVVRALVEASGGRRFVWTDDDLPAYPQAVDWARESTDGLCVAPRREVGLTPDDLLLIRAYLGDV